MGEYGFFPPLLLLIFMVELHRRAGDDARATKQAEMNRQLSVVVEKLSQRGS